jgi:ATP-dependent Clp protease ATP-binding subunit ClpA
VTISLLLWSHRVQQVGQDFFYICASHLNDRGFASPIIDAEAEAARLKKEAMDKEIAKVKAEYEEKQKKKKAKKKDKDAKEKEKKVDDDDEKERDDKVWRSEAFRACLTYLLADQVYHRQN